MRILHLAHQYPPEYVGGTEQYTQALVSGLAERGHQIAVFYRRSAEGTGLDRRDEGRVQVWIVWSGLLDPTHRFLAAFGDAPISYAFRQALEQTRPDLIHVQHLMGLPVNIVTQIRQAAIPFVLTLHDYWWICANAQLLTNYSQQICGGPQRYLNCARCALARAGHSGLWTTLPLMAALMAWRAHLLRRVLRGASALIAPTEFVRRWYLEHGVPAETISVIPHGIKPPAPKPGRRRGTDGRVRFVYIGGLSWQKGVHIAIEAFNQLDGPVELWLGGDESAEPAYVQQLKQQAHHPGIRFLGRLNRAAVWQTLADADAVLIPSLWYETSSLIAQEALAMGIPILASRLGALEERVYDGVDGLLVPPGDVAAWRAAMQRMVDKPDLDRRRQSNICPVTTLAEHVTQLEFLYTKVLKRN